MAKRVDDNDENQRLHMIVPVAWVRQVNDWRRQQPDLPSLSEAVRQLVELGLASVRKGAARKSH